MSFQFSKCWCMQLIFIEQLREREIFKIGLLYTEQEKCSCKLTLLKEKIPDLMQAFPLDTEIIVSADQKFCVSCFMSFQFSKCWCMQLIFIEQLREREIFKIGLLYTEQEKCSCKLTLLKEKIPDLMQAFPLDTESH